MKKISIMLFVVIVSLVSVSAATYAEDSEEKTKIDMTVSSFQGILMIKRDGGDWEEVSPYDRKTLKRITVSEGTEIKVLDGYKKEYRSITDVDQEIKYYLEICEELEKYKNIETLLHERPNTQSKEANKKALSEIKDFFNTRKDLLELLYKRNRFGELKNICNRYLLDQWFSIDDATEKKLFKEKNSDVIDINMDEVVEELGRLIPRKEELLMEMRDAYVPLKTLQTELRIKGEAIIWLGPDWCGRILSLYGNTHVVIETARNRNGVLDISLGLKRGRLFSELYINPSEERYDVNYKIVTGNANVEYSRADDEEKRDNPELKRDNTDIRNNLLSFGVKYDSKKNITEVLSEEGCVSLQCRWYLGADSTWVCRYEKTQLEGCFEPTNPDIIKSDNIKEFKFAEPMGSRSSAGQQ